METRLQSHYESMTRIIQFIRMADNKAAPVLALQVALVGTLAARFDKLLPVILADQVSIGQIVLCLLIGTYLANLIAVIWFAATVYVPVNPNSGEDSLIYFQDISSIERQDFIARAKALGCDEIERQILDQIHRVSQVASRKMHRVRWAFILSAPSGVLWLALFIWASVQPA